MLENPKGKVFNLVKIPKTGVNVNPNLIFRWVANYVLDVNCLIINNGK